MCTRELFTQAQSVKSYSRCVITLSIHYASTIIINSGIITQSMKKKYFFYWSHPDVFSLSIPRVRSVKTQLIYCELKWRHVSTQGVTMRPIIESRMRYINWKWTFLGSQNVYNSKRTWVELRLIFTILYILTLRRLMSYIYIYIWSTHSWCF